MPRGTYNPKSAIGSLVIVVSMSAAALPPTEAIGQTQQPSVLTCVQTVLSKNDKGKAVVKITDSVIAQTAAGTSEVILEIDPKCLGQTNSTAPDKYAEARKAVDNAVEQSGLPPEKKQEAKNRLNNTIDQAQKDNQDPVKDLETANEANAAAGDKNNDKDTAMLAAIGAVAAACIVASAGVCSAAALAILPSLLPPDISNKDVAGVARAIQGAAQGRPISPDDTAILQRILNQNTGKLETQAKQQLEKFIQNGSTALKVKVAEALKIDAAKVDAGAQFLREAVLTGQFKCDGLERAMGMTQAIRLRSDIRDSIVETLMTNVTVMRNSDKVNAEARKCLAKIIVSS